MEGVGDLEAGEVDDLLDEAGQPRGLDEDPLGEPLDGDGVLLRVEDGLGEQRDAADRGLQLMADVGDEVAADLLDAPRLGVVLGEDEHVRDGQRRDAHPHDGAGVGVGPAGEVELGLADHPVAADLAGEVAQLAVDELAVPDEPVADRRGGGVDDGVARVEDDGDGAQDRQHLAHAAGQRRLLGVGSGRAALGPARRDDGDRPDDEADRPAEGRREHRVHVSQGTARDTPLRRTRRPVGGGTSRCSPSARLRFTAGCHSAGGRTRDRPSHRRTPHRCARPSTRSSTGSPRPSSR